MSIKKFFKTKFPSLFYGLKAKSYAKKPYLSQVGQDFWVINEVFNEKKCGYFIEVGSADGTSYSNTFLLEKRYNWKGICIEANPDFYEELKFVRSAVCIQKCISSNQDNMLFLKDSVCGHVLSEAPEKNSENVITVSTCSLEQVLIEQNAPNVIDYLSIDVEGHEDAVLLNFPFDNYLFNSITIERPSEALRSHLKHHGYIIIKEIIDLDVFYIHETFLKSHCKNLFSYWAKCAK